MLLFLSIFLVLAAVALIGFIVRREVAKSLLEQAPLRELPQPQYRPLFEPAEDELRAEASAEAKKVKEIESQESLKQAEEKLAKFEELRQTWAQSPTRGSTINLLYEASQIADGTVYLETCERILTSWHAGEIADLSADDLAQLLESHFWLLPDSQRTPGVSFRLKQEIAGLRRESEESI
jgi:hypothetical protein